MVSTLPPGFEAADGILVISGACVGEKGGMCKPEGAAVRTGSWVEKSGGFRIAVLAVLTWAGFSYGFCPAAQQPASSVDIDINMIRNLRALNLDFNITNSDYTKSIYSPPLERISVL